MNKIKVKDLKFSYGQDPILKKVDFSVDVGQIALILGENGSGKSTFLKLLLGELRAGCGEIEILGERIENLASYEKFGYVPQVQSFNQIAFPITVLEIVVLSLYREFGFLKIPRKGHKEKAKEILQKFGLSNFIHTPFNELSGGLKQRTMIARALMHEPEILILDEPTAGVDQDSKEDFLHLIKKLNQKYGITVVVVSHEIGLMKNILMPNKIYEMRGGRLENVAV